MKETTPMMDQYQTMKEQYPDSILFFRLGDFYEMFFSDAEIAAREIGLTLTSRGKGGGGKAPMAGVPYHSAETYISKLIEKGYRVAICEQMEDPSQAKGIVERDVVRVISPGTIIDEGMLKAEENNFLILLCRGSEHWGLGYVDISTGEMGITEFPLAQTGNLHGEIGRLQPKELHVPREVAENIEFQELVHSLQDPLITYHEGSFNYRKGREFLTEQLGMINLEGIGLEGREAGTMACADLCHLLLTTQKRPLSYVDTIRYYSVSSFMILDNHTRRNLELNQGMFQGSARGSLVDILDRTETAMGSRLLKKWVNQPLLNEEEIQHRLDAVEELRDSDALRGEIIQELSGMYDLERLLARVGYGTANARDMVALKHSLAPLPRIQKALNALNCYTFLTRHAAFDTLDDVHDLLATSLAPEPPVSLTEGGLIQKGYHKDLDEIKTLVVDGKSWIANLEAEEKKRTGIKSLKVGFNKVFGYYIEVTRPNLHLVPQNYIRKQTLANSERYFTQDLKEKENVILGAEEKINNMEYELFLDLRQQVREESQRIQKTASILAELDTLLSLAQVALERNYCRPQIHGDTRISIKEGRHPVVEASLEGQQFVPNDTFMDTHNHRFHLITGPNMAGKSTYLRQVALLVLMAQIGSFVPAQKAEIGLVDRIFTRVGASDDLTRGKSTFLVEMNEVAQILHGATSRSFILLDEVGRGTSTYDGLSIAWAVMEYINNPQRIGARTLFATHYHELTSLAEKHDGIQNYNVAVEKDGDHVIFLHVIKKGSADESYGIHVARLAGIPPEVLYRAREVLESLENNSQPRPEPPRMRPLFPDYGFEEERSYLQEIAALDIMNMTPMEAMQSLYQWQEKIKSHLEGKKK